MTRREEERQELIAREEKRKELLSTGRFPVGTAVGHKKVVAVLSEIWGFTVNEWTVRRFVTAKEDPLPCGDYHGHPFIDELELRAWAKRQKFYHPGIVVEARADHKAPRAWKRPGRIPKPGRMPGVTWVYFVQGKAGGPVKIGISVDVDERLAGLQTSNPEKLAVLTKFRGDADDESCLHFCFMNSWIQGEWFAETPKLLRFIEGVRSDEAECQRQATEGRPEGLQANLRSARERMARYGVTEDGVAVLGVEGRSAPSDNHSKRGLCVQEQGPGMGEETEETAGILSSSR